MDEREEELRQQWDDHRQRFKSGAKRSSLRGVIKSSYLTELSENGGRRPRGRGGSGVVVAAAVAAASSSSSDGGAGGEGGQRAGSSRSSAPHARRVSRHGEAGDTYDDDDDSWEDVRVSPKDIPAAAAVAAAPRLPPPRETVHVLTTPGPTRVTIVGDRGGGGPAGGGPDGGEGTRPRPRLSVLTLHAAGHNHRTCLGALEREVANDVELGGGGGGGTGVVFYHVDTPGHEEEATTIE